MKGMENSGRWGATRGKKLMAGVNRKKLKSSHDARGPGGGRGSHGNADDFSLDGTVGNPNPLSRGQPGGLGREPGLC